MSTFVCPLLFERTYDLVKDNTCDRINYTDVNTAALGIHANAAAADLPLHLKHCVLYSVTAASLILWSIITFNNVGLGAVFSYKGPTVWYRLIRKLAMLGWWTQAWIIYIAFTWHNYLVFDSLAIFLTLAFGGGFYDDWNKVFGTKFNATINYLLCFAIQLSHHGCIAYFLLFESDANKLLYRWVFFYAWISHFMGSAHWTLDVVKKLDERIKMFHIYHYSLPFYVLYWYLYVFGASQNQWISPGLLMITFGRYTASYCVNLSHPWRTEGYLVMLLVSSAFEFFFRRIFVGHDQ